MHFRVRSRITSDPSQVSCNVFSPSALWSFLGSFSLVPSPGRGGRRDLRDQGSWTHLALVATVLAMLKGLLAWCTVLPDATGWMGA